MVNVSSSPYIALPEDGPPEAGSERSSPHQPRRSRTPVCFITGKPKYGSWQVRGEQIAGTRANWRARPSRDVNDEDLETCDVFCFVKVPDADLLERILVKGKTAVHDVVDWWRQPRDHRKVTNTREARQLFLRRWRRLPPFHGHIFACRAMYADLAPLSPFPTVIYHHYRPGLRPGRVRQTRLTVGYEGKECYLGGWKRIVTELCHKHDMEFVAERIRTRPVDIGFAARGDKYSGYLPDNYKSNVKLANCYGAGIPAIMPANQAAYRETAARGVAWFNTPAEIDDALTRLADFKVRSDMAHANMKAAASFTLTRTADRYEAFFTRLRSSHKYGLID